MARQTRLSPLTSLIGVILDSARDCCFGTPNQTRLGDRIIFINCPLRWSEVHFELLYLSLSNCYDAMAFCIVNFCLVRLFYPEIVIVCIT